MSARSPAFRLALGFSFVEFVTSTADIKPAVLWAKRHFSAVAAFLMAAEGTDGFKSFSLNTHKRFEVNDCEGTLSTGGTD